MLREAVFIPKTEQRPSIERLGGLTAKDTIAKDIATISSAPLVFQGGEKRMVFSRRSVFMPSVESADSVSQEFGREFEEDVENFNRRLLLLKIRIIREMRKSSESGPQHVSDFLKTDSLKDSVVKGDVDAQVSREIIAAFNASVLPEERLPYIKKIETEDYEAMLECLKTESTIPNKVRKNKLSGILQELANIERKLTVVGTQGELFDTHTTGYVREEDFKNVWEDFRNLIVELSAVEEIGSWQSPTYGASRRKQMGSDQTQAVQNDYDYQRVGSILDRDVGNRVERTLLGEEKQGELRASLLFGSGMHAFHAIMQTLTRFVPERPTVFAQDVYFEIDGYLDGRSPFRKDRANKQVIMHGEEYLRADFIERIKNELPDIILIAPISNSHNLFNTQLRSIIENISADTAWTQKITTSKKTKDKKMFLVVDDTITTGTSDWTNFNFSQLPPFITVISFQSLLKYTQEGLDLGNLGMATIYGSNDHPEIASALYNELQEERKAVGAPSENNLRRVDAVLNKTGLENRMQRIGRNTQIIGDAIRNILEKRGSRIIARTTSTTSEKSVQSGFHTDTAGLVMIDFDFSFVDSLLPKGLRKPEAKASAVKKIVGDVTSAFEKTIIRLASEYNIDLHMGSSFGFNNTRLAIYDRVRTRGDHSVFFDEESKFPAFMRVCPGTENIKDATKIAAIICRAEAVFSEAIDKGVLGDLVEMIQKNDNNVELSTVEQAPAKDVLPEFAEAVAAIEIRNREQLMEFFRSYIKNQTIRPVDYFKPDTDTWIVQRVNNILGGFSYAEEERLPEFFLGTYQDGHIVSTAHVTYDTVDRRRIGQVQITEVSAAPSSEGGQGFSSIVSAVEKKLVTPERKITIAAEISSRDFVLMADALQRGYYLTRMIGLDDPVRCVFTKEFGRANKKIDDEDEKVLSVLDINRIKKYLADGYVGVAMVLPTDDVEEENWSMVLKKEV